MKLKDKKGFKILNFISKTISWCVMVILIMIGFFLVTYVAINKIAQAKGLNPPMGLYTIISPSMTPGIQVYDVVFVVKKDAKDIQIGDIVSYYSTNSYFGKTPITHRVVEKFNGQDGSITFRTRGDANPVMDDEVVMSNNIIGTVRFVIPQLGRVQFFLASKGGWFIAILVPALGIIIYDIMKLIKLIKVKNKMDEMKSLELEEEKKTTRRRRTSKNIDK